MAGLGATAKLPSLPPPRPKSPPDYPDLYGKRRELAKVQMLEREIGFLEDELKFVEGLQPASKSCKEVADFVAVNSDPLMPTTKRVHRSCCFWKWLCGSSCFSFSWICCQECIPHIDMPHCCDCNLRDCISCPSCSCIRCSKPKCHCCSCLNSQCFRKSKCHCCSCLNSQCFRKPKCHCCSCLNSQCFRKPKCHCCSCLNSQCFRKPSCSLSCYIPKCRPCSNCFCNGCTSCYPKCLKINLWSCCTKNCCYNCCICY